MVKKILSHAFLRFLLVGGLNTAFGYFTFSVYTFFLGNAYVSIVLATVTGVLFNFKTYGVMVFKSHNNSRVFRFFLAYGILIGIQLILLKWLNSWGITNPYLAVGILVLPMAGLSFILLRRFVFHQALLLPEEPGKDATR